MVEENGQKRFAFTKVNYILVIIGIILVVFGFLLMQGAGTTETHFEEDIFSVRRIKVAPVMSFIGYAFLIIAIMFKKKENKNG